VAERGPAAEQRERLEQLDGALGRIRRLWDQPSVRAWYRARLDLEIVDATTYRTLRAIRLAADSEPSVNGVAEIMRVDASTASRFVERAVTAGYARRSPSPDDRRRSTLQLTELGLGRLLEVRDLRVRLLDRLTDGWSPAAVDALTSALVRLDEAVGTITTDDDDA
jgi:DNA-binding MarR family transcriptional regulator